MYGTAFRGIYPWLLEIKSINLVTLCKYINEILLLMCAKKLFFWKYIETKKSFWRDFLTKNIFCEVILVFDSWIKIYYETLP